MILLLEKLFVESLEKFITCTAVSSGPILFREDNSG